jgi:hypothetical protein
MRKIKGKSCSPRVKGLGQARGMSVAGTFFGCMHSGPLVLELGRKSFSANKHHHHHHQVIRMLGSWRADMPLTGNCTAPAAARSV